MLFTSKMIFYYMHLEANLGNDRGNGTVMELTSQIKYARFRGQGTFKWRETNEALWQFKYLLAIYIQSDIIFHIKKARRE